MVCKVSAICLTALLLLSFTFTSTYAGRYQLSFTDVTPVEAHQHDELKGGIDEAVDNKKFQEEESCERGDDEVECLMRRTLAAHIDYIYTQKQNP